MPATATRRRAATAEPTAKQLSFFNTLLAERGIDTIEAFAPGTTRRQASAAISDLLKGAKPKPATSAAPPVTATTPGVYEHPDGTIYIVKPTRDKQRTYAKRLVEINAERATENGDRVHIEFEYAPGAIRTLTPDMRMPLERAKALTVRYGRCIVCGRHLKAAESVERGIGPVCIKSFAAEVPADMPEPERHSTDDGYEERILDAENAAKEHADWDEECLDSGPDCSGPVKVRMLPDNPRSFPRCEHHFEQRLARSERNLELVSDTPAPWFDAGYAGEQWDED
jgi:hypothetical protein